MDHHLSAGRCKFSEQFFGDLPFVFHFILGHLYNVHILPIS